MSSVFRVQALYRARPRDRFVRGSLLGFALVVTGSWASGVLRVSDLFGARRWDNVRRFVTHDALPGPWRRGERSFGSLVEWAVERWNDVGAIALETTLWISIAAIVLAAALAVVPSFAGAYALGADEPYSDEEPPRGLRLWLARGVRWGCVLARAIPEYVWAFLFLALLGASAWPAVLALALHNGGILGRLGADTLENVERRAPATLWQAGARRPGLAVFALAPSAIGRMLAYFFYRWETCVREATVLGMLGVVSLGYFVQEARSRQRYDELLFLVALGGLLVLVGDLVSIAARAWIRRGGARIPLNSRLVRSRQLASDVSGRDR